jgi:alpha-beta hydrolase superfamily lysophospholipase
MGTCTCSSSKTDNN